MQILCPKYWSSNGQMGNAFDEASGQQFLTSRAGYAFPNAGADSEACAPLEVTADKRPVNLACHGQPGQSSCTQLVNKYIFCIAVQLRPQHDKSVLVISRHDYVAPMHGISKQVGKREVVTVLTRRGSRSCGRAIHSSR